MSKPRRPAAAQDPLASLLAQALSAHQQGQLAQAEQLYDHILQQQPAHFGALHYSGVLYMQSARAARGVERIEQALQQREAADALSNLANGLIQLKRHADALKALDRSLTLSARQSAAHTNRGLALAALGRFDEAVLAHRKAQQLQPVFPEALNNLGNALRALGQHAEAIKALDRALAQRPGYPEALNNKGLAQAAAGQHEAALASYALALAKRPRYAEAHNNRGNALKELRRFDEAQTAYDQALGLAPDYTEARYNRGNNLGAQNRHHEAIAEYNTALALQHDHADAQWNKGLSQLLLGDYANGLKQYTWRWQLARADAPRSFDCPEWDGQAALAGRHIILWAEQGLGDTLQFCRLASQLARTGARVSLEVQPALHALLSQLAGVHVFARGQTPPAADYHCPLLNLPQHLQLTLANLPSPRPYLAPDASRLAHWQQRLPPGTRRIALCCSGNAALGNDHNRSIPLAWFDALHAPGHQIVLMQKDLRDADRDALRTRPHILDLHDELKDFDDTAAALAQCDLLISVDTSVAHLAGAQGLPVCLLLPFLPDWRWGLDRPDTPWYPNTRLLRQPAPGDWASVLNQLPHSLR